jgi:hypothetical protein
MRRLGTGMPLLFWFRSGSGSVNLSVGAFLLVCKGHAEVFNLNRDANSHACSVNAHVFIGFNWQLGAFGELTQPITAQTFATDAIMPSGIKKLLWIFQRDEELCPPSGPMLLTVAGLSPADHSTLI